MSTLQRNSVLALALALAVLATWNWYLEASQEPQKRPDGPFIVLGTQETPPVTLFEHKPSGRCYMGWKTGGLIAVDTEVCKKNGGFPFIPIILPPIDTVSPER